MKVSKIIDSNWEMFAEAAYRGNLGLMELVQFRKVASPEQNAKMDEIVANKDWEGFRAIIKEVLNIELL